MSTIRIAKRDRFLRMDSRAVNDVSLSFRARGLLAWLLEKPDNWSIDAVRIADHCTEGRDAVRTALDELENVGYLVRHKYRDVNGKWRSESILYEHPNAADFQDTDAENPHRFNHDGFSGVNTNTSPNGEVIQPTILTIGEAETNVPVRRRDTGTEADPQFTRFWKAYPRSEAKTAARKAWRKAILIVHADPEELIRIAERWGDQVQAGADPQFVPHAATWLNGQRWDDPLPVPKQQPKRRTIDDELVSSPGEIANILQRHKTRRRGERDE